jgi:hypothetical protein
MANENTFKIIDIEMLILQHKQGTPERGAVVG